MNQSKETPPGAAPVESPEIILIGELWKEQFRSFKKSAFRLELLQAYAEPTESECFRAFLRCSPIPEHWIEDWCSLVRNHLKAGRWMERVHVVDLPLSQYLRFEIECAYRLTSRAGEQIGLLNRAAIPPALSSLLTEDFWLFDDEMVMIQDYDAAGTLLQARIVRKPAEVAPYVHLKNETFRLAVRFEDFYRSLRGPR